MFSAMGPFRVEDMDLDLDLERLGEDLFCDFRLGALSLEDIAGLEKVEKERWFLPFELKN
eukprot:14683437-Alexandrium_andersonii.AAC.1